MKTLTDIKIESYVNIDTSASLGAAVDVMKGLAITAVGLVGIWGLACMVSAVGSYGLISTLSALFTVL